ncbi:MAG: AIR synthase-related protein [Polyangiaceae bacterium]
MTELVVERFEVAVRPEHKDPRADAVLEAARHYLEIAPATLRTRDVYRVQSNLDASEAERVLRELVDPVLQRGARGRLEDEGYDFAVTVGFKPGVTDPVGKSALVAVADTLGRALPADSQVYTSTLYLFKGVDRAQAERIALELLANPVIQTIEVQSAAELQSAPPDLHVPRVLGHGTRPTEPVELPDDDEALQALSDQRLLALTLPELRAIREHFLQPGQIAVRRALGLGPSPTDAELECLAQTWSEHCKHKIFNARIHYEEPGRAAELVDSVFKKYIRGATEAVAQAQAAPGLPPTPNGFLVSVFHDNAGVVTFDDDYHLVYKVETHNSPSALDPYGGAMTGIVGVNRDPFGTGLGAELLCNVWGYCFASPEWSEPLPKGLLHPRRVRAGVHQGVIDGGNQSGVPYARGWELFDARFVGKPLVFCGTVGRLPTQVTGRPGHEKAARPGDKIVMVGGRIGADGIHGATFSSAALDESAPVQAVQIGDPITQKRMFDFLLEARDAGLYTAITDNGAGGLSSSVGEMAEKPGGARLDLSLAPLKYQGLAPWEILVSEAQERMTLAVPPEHVAELLELSRRREVEATVLGEFADTGVFHVQYADKTVAHLSMSFLHEGNPRLEINARHEVRRHDEPTLDETEDLGHTLLALLERHGLASNETLARKYDHEVKALTAVKPWVGEGRDVPAEASVLLVRHDSLRGYVLAEGVNPFLSDIDAYAMATNVVDLAVRRVLCAGAPMAGIALLDNFCWPDPVASAKNPDGAYKAAQLVRACRGLYDACVAYGAPLISGKDSMKNDSTMGGVRVSVPPTLLVSALGQIDDVARAVTLDPKTPGEVVYLLGAPGVALGGSEYYRHLGSARGVRAELGMPAPYVGNDVAHVDFATTRLLYRTLTLATGAGLVQSAATPALGGLALCFARMTLASRLGMEVNLEPSAAPNAAALFSEAGGRFVVTVAPPNVAAFETLMSGRAAVRIGTVTERAQLRISRAGRTLVDVSADQLAAHFKSRLD